MLKTLASKHRSSVTKMAARHKAKVPTPHGLRTRFEANVERPGRKHWSPGSAAFHSSGRRRRSSPTVSTPGPSTRTGAWSPGY